MRLRADQLLDPRDSGDIGRASRGRTASLKRSLFALRILITLPLSLCWSGSSAAPPHLTIVNGYEGQAAFSGAARGADMKQLWRDDVVGPYLDRCAGGGDYFVLAQFALSTPISDVEGLQAEIGSLRKSTMELHQALEVAFQRAEQLLPAADTQLCVFAADPEMTIIRDMGGVSGLTAGAGRLFFECDLKDLG